MTLGLTCDVVDTFRYSAMKLFIKELDFGSRWVEVGHRQLALAKLDPLRTGLLNRRTMLEERPSKTALSRWTVSDGRCWTITVRLMRAFSRSTTDPERGSGGTCCHRVLSWSTTSMTSDWTAVSRLTDDISGITYMGCRRITHLFENERSTRALARLHDSSTLEISAKLDTQQITRSQIWIISMAIAIWPAGALASSVISWKSCDTLCAGISD